MTEHCSEGVRCSVNSAVTHSIYFLTVRTLLENSGDRPELGTGTFLNYLVIYSEAAVHVQLH